MPPTRSRFTSIVACFPLIWTAAPAAGFTPLADKHESTFYGPRSREIVQNNAKRYAWAKAEVDKALAEAQVWIDRSDEDLWILAPELPRAIGVNRDLGCPKCGPAIYGERGSNLYAFIATVPGHPWKVQCPNCRELFPKNDFLAFYRSGISPEDGLFHYARADRKLLFNAEHPDPSDPLHTWCVDDGRGWIDTNKGPQALHTFIATYVYRGAWRVPISTFARAYAMTGEPKYAHKAAILLDRLADVYPGFVGINGQILNFAPGEYWNGIIGPDYWEGGGWAGLAIAYDMIYDALGKMPETLAFIQRQAARYKVPSSKKTIEEVKRHIEQRLFIDRFSKRATYQMNGTISEMFEAKVDFVLRGRKAIQEFAAVHMPRIVPPRFLNEDGSGNERSIGYDGGAASEYAQLLVDLYDMDRVVALQAIRGYPKFQAVFDFWPDIWCIDGYLPNIGDTYNDPGLRSGTPGSAGAYIRLFDLTGNPRYAQVALMAVGGDVSKLPRNIFHPDPEGIFQRAEAVWRAAGEWYTPSLVKADYRLGILRAGRGRDQLALWFFYSPHAGTSSHSHFDALNFGLFAYDLPLVCEQGYPLFTGGWPSRWEWTSHTRSHATVTVDGAQQEHCDGGTLLGFSGGPGVQMISAEAPCAYKQTSVYKRTLLLVEALPGKRFVLDVFRVKGGRQHIYSVPIYYGQTTYQGPDLTAQPDFYAGYVEQVRAGALTGPWMVDTHVLDRWQGRPAAHLRVHGLPMDAQLLIGQGETRLGNDRPERLPYLLVKRDGKDLDTTFVLLFEPYASEPLLGEQPLSATVHSDHVGIGVRIAENFRYDFVVRDGDPKVTRVEVSESRAGATSRRSLPARVGALHQAVMERPIGRTVRASYLLHVPPAYEQDRSRRWPLILFLHGAGERGDDPVKIQNLGPLKYAAQHADFPFVVVAPQCPLGSDWAPDMLIGVLDEVEKRCRIDRDRVYVTGYSMGGAGTWELAMDYTDRFAAIAPLCGRVIPLLSGNLWRTPTWVFHGDADDVVPLAQSKEMAEILKGMGNENVRFTIYPGADHNIWHRTYENPELYAWFLQHRRSDRE
ncbi:MAG: hypothetical protein AMXMBFR13_05620 [Phycisphaerae bacterium]